MARVLIFDDDLDILELCAIVLKSRGFETFTESSCRNVIEKIRHTSPDVILMDNWIPDIGGVEASRLVKSTPDISHIPIIFFSANSNVEAYAKEAQADFCLRKPFDIIELQNMVVQALKKPRIASPLA